MGQLEQNKEVARRYFEELWQDNGAGQLENLVSPTFYQHHVRNRDEDLIGPAALRNWLKALHENLSQVQMRVELAFAEQDHVVLYLRGTGNYKAPKQASSSPLRWTTTAMLRLADGRVAESWVISDTLGVLQQTGVVAKLG